MTLDDTIKFWQRALENAHLSENMGAITEARMRLAAATAARDEQRRKIAYLEAALTRLGLPCLR